MISYKTYITNASVPLVILNEGEQEGARLWKCCEEQHLPAFNLLSISGMNWEDDLSPWPTAALYKKTPAFGGKADVYLNEIIKRILPTVMKEEKLSPSQTILAGYSLAGLFAVYASTRCDCFDGIISASGSLWYPDFAEYIRDNSPSEKTGSFYFSLGNKEPKTKNPTMATVGDCTQEIAALLQEENRNVIFEWNEGGHFADDALRLAKGIAWMLQ